MISIEKIHTSVDISDIDISGNRKERLKSALEGTLLRLISQMPKVDVIQDVPKHTYKLWEVSYLSGGLLSIKKTGSRFYVYLRKNGAEVSYSKRLSFLARDAIDFVQSEGDIQDFISRLRDIAVKEESLISEAGLDYNKESASDFFKVNFLNTGKTLKEVISLMRSKGYSSTSTLQAVVDVLKDTTWVE